MNNSVKLKRHFNHFLTYLYLVVLSVIIIYPLHQPLKLVTLSPSSLILISIGVLTTSAGSSLRHSTEPGTSIRSSLLS